MKGWVGEGGVYRKGGGREYVQEGVEGGVCVERGVKGVYPGSGGVKGGVQEVVG